MSIKYALQEKITLLSSLVHGVFNYTSSNMVIDLQVAELDKRQRKAFKRLDDYP